MEKGGIDENGHDRCFFCDGIVVHEGSDMAQEVYTECNEEDVLHYMACERCGAEYEIIQRNNPTFDHPMGEELQLRKRMLND